jgi:penicillin-binding protein 1A
VNLAPFFLHEIKQLLQKEFSEEVIMRGGLRVYTTLDFQRQRAARDQLINSIQRQQKIFTDKAKKYKKRSKKHKELTAAAEKTEGAFISLDPLSGYTLTMVGGKEFSGKNMFNRSLLAKRQLGSVIKPLIFYLAIKDKIITPAMQVEDKPLKIGRFDYNNYDNKYLGKISWLDALRKSRNTTAVRLLQLVGIDELHEVLAKILDQPLSTIKKKVPREMGVALGTPVFTPMEVAQIYATIASGGIRIKPRMLLRVDDVQGKVVFKPREIIREEQVLDKTATFILLSMMKETFSSEGTARWVARLRGTRDDFLAFEVAGKTGTTSDYRDAWFAGLTSDEVSIVWLGTDNNYSLGSGRSGGAVCSPVWVNYIQQVRKDSPPQPIGNDWKLPGTIKQSFCNSSGGVPRSAGSCPDVIENAVFYEGTEPRFFDSRPGTQEAPGKDPVEDPVIIPTGDL